VTGLITEAGRVIGAHLADGSRVDCTHVIRCVGAHRAGERPVMAMNLLVPLLQLSENAEAVVLAHPDEGRNVFVVPWRGHSMIGTWNRDYPGEAEAPFALRLEWIDEMLRWLTPVHPQLAALTRSDIRLVHAGLVPRAPGSREPEPASQTRLETPLPGLTDVVGVKWTTAWGVAIGVVERVLGKTADPEPVLARFHGDLARTATTEDALRFAVEAEWATHLDDVLLRRLRIAATGHPGTPRVEAASRFLQPLLDWSERERHSEVEAFHALPVFAGNIKAE
jgi:glycerol-3-phosphate dehydrogenase